MVVEYEERRDLKRRLGVLGSKFQVSMSNCPIYSRNTVKDSRGLRMTCLCVVHANVDVVQETSKITRWAARC